VGGKTETIFMYQQTIILEYYIYTKCTEYAKSMKCCVTIQVSCAYIKWFILNNKSSNKFFLSSQKKNNETALSNSLYPKTSFTQKFHLAQRNSESASSSLLLPVEWQGPAHWQLDTLTAFPVPSKPWALTGPRWGEDGSQLKTQGWSLPGLPDLEDGGITSLKTF
jgi:hypothetical protein